MISLSSCSPIFPPRIRHQTSTAHQSHIWYDEHSLVASREQPWVWSKSQLRPPFFGLLFRKKPPRPMGDLMSWGIISGLMKEFISTKRPWFPWTGSTNGITGNHVETWRYREKISGRRIWKKRCEDDSHVNTMGIHGIKPRVLHEVESLSSTFGPMMSGPINLRSTHRNYACRVPRFEKVGAGPQLIHSMCESAPIPTSAFSFLSGCAWIPCIP